MKKYIHFAAAFILAAFGLLTLFMSSSVIFDFFGIRAKEGNYVLFVVWANFFCGFLYLISAFGFIKRKQNSVKVLAAALGILLITFVGLLLHIYSGGIYETKTIGAMVFRILLTLVFTIIAYFTITKKKS